MSNAARGNAPAHPRTDELWHLLDSASLALAHIYGGLEVLLLAATSAHVDQETRHALEFIRDGLTERAGEVHEALEKATEIALAARGGAR